MQSANEPAGQVQAGRAEIARLRAGAECVRARGRYRVRGAELSHWRDEAERVFGMINHAMQHLPDFRPWPRESLYDLMESLLPVADGELVFFAETEDGQVVGWLPGIPKLNEALIHAGGLRYPWDHLPTTRAPRSSSGISAR